MKIYTRKGDGGETSLANGKRVRKDDLQVELYGTADELNSSIGCAFAAFALDSSPKTDGITELKRQLQYIQGLLFELGAELSGYYREPSHSVIQKADLELIESWIDLFSEKLEPMKSFILPGGTSAAAHLHLSRTICRRLERLMVACTDHEGLIQPSALEYTNRLSDYLFVAARFTNHQSGVLDIPWKSREK